MSISDRILRMYSCLRLARRLGLASVLLRSKARRRKPSTRESPDVDAAVGLADAQREQYGSACP